MEFRLNGETREFQQGESVADLVQALDLRPEQVAVELNRKLLPRSQRAETLLAEGDELEFVTLVGGG
jgi:thiamine biosynthesis protein ThiS